MDLPLIKKKLIEKIQSSNDEILIVELLDMVEQHNVVAGLSAEQRQALSERISRVEEGNAVYLNAKEEAEKLRKKLNDL
ncbi:hypothetical protein LBMAG27_08170 [Bacteroidota bacterium]|nr:hypothetical protein LBMAG27_08170 [Bacteroidota bacterium]